MGSGNFPVSIACYVSGVIHMSVHPTMNTAPPLSWPTWEAFLDALESIVPIHTTGHGQGTVQNPEVFPMTLQDIDEAMQERSRRQKTMSYVFPADADAPVAQRPDSLQGYVDQQPAQVIYNRMGRPRASESI